MAVVADTGPLNYLILIEAVEVLPRLFSSILIPAIVGDELSHPKTPAPVRSWIGHPPAWLNIEGPGALPATAGGRALIPKSGLGGPSLCAFAFGKGWGCFSLASFFATVGSLN